MASMMELAACSGLSAIVTALTTQTQSAPARTTAATLVRSIPPMATTGCETAAFTAAIVSGADGLAGALAHGRGGVDGAHGEVVGAGGLRLQGLLHAVVGAAHDLGVGEDAAGVGDGQVGLADMEAVGGAGERDGRVIVHDEEGAVGGAKLLDARGPFASTCAGCR